MQTKNFSSKSLHWRLATFYGNHSEWGTDTDICAYSRQVVWGLFKYLWVLVMVAAAGVLTGGPLGWVAYVIWNLTWISPDWPFLIMPGIALGFLLLAGLLAVKEKFESWADKRAGAVIAPSFAREAYKSFKEKTCFRVKIED